MSKFIKLSLALSIVLILLNFNVFGAYDELKYKSFTAYDITMPYRIYVPDEYETKQYPVILFLHGAGERGIDNEFQLEGPFSHFYNNEFLADNPAIILVPQCLEDKQWVDTDWTKGDYSIDEIEETVYLKLAYEILQSTINDYNVDISKIYITGISMGGYGTWDMLMRYPNIFAAAIPICGAGDSGNVEIVKDIPIWAFHGDADTVVPISGILKIDEVFTNLESDNFQLTVYENGNHDAWTQTYKNIDVFNWMFQQKKVAAYDYTSAIADMEIENQEFAETIDIPNDGSFNFKIVIVIASIIIGAIIMGFAVLIVILPIKTKNR